MSYVPESIPERLMDYFDEHGCLGVSELIRCLNREEYGATIGFFKARNISVQYQTLQAQGDFIYYRDPVQPLRQFVEISKMFQHLSLEEKQIVDAVCLEIAESLNGSGVRSLFEGIEISFSTV